VELNFITYLPKDRTHNHSNLVNTIK